LLIEPDGGGSPSLFLSNHPSRAPVVVGDTYTSILAIFETKSAARTFRPDIPWYGAAGAYVSTTTGVGIAATSGAWKLYTVSGVAPATAGVAASQSAVVGSSATDPFYVDCFAICPGDYTRWHLPSQSPGLVEFDSAPASGTRITATATGQRVTRCRFEPGTRWSMRSPGHASVRSVRAIEWPEF
jgi:hypothetical protein